LAAEGGLGAYPFLHEEPSMVAALCSNQHAVSGEQEAAPGHRRNLLTLDLPGRAIAFHRGFVTLTGSIAAALKLSQAVYWQRRCRDSHGWWWKTMQHWAEETGLQRRDQENARRRLKELGLLSETRRGIPARLYFQVDISALNRLLQENNVIYRQYAQNVQTCLSETDNQECTKPPNKIAQNAQTSLAQSDNHLLLILRLLLR
jgi:hypothetical protein